MHDAAVAVGIRQRFNPLRRLPADGVQQRRLWRAITNAVPGGDRVLCLCLAPQLVADATEDLAGRGFEERVPALEVVRLKRRRGRRLPARSSLPCEGRIRQSAEHIKVACQSELGAERLVQTSLCPAVHLQISAQQWQKERLPFFACDCAVICQIQCADVRTGRAVRRERAPCQEDVGKRQPQQLRYFHRHQRTHAEAKQGHLCGWTAPRVLSDLFRHQL